MIQHVVVLLLLVAAPTAAESWHEHYEHGLRELDAGRGAEARLALEAAVALNPEPGLRAHTEGPRYVDYMPYLYLAVASHMAGDLEAARDYLARSEEAGIADQTEEGRKLLEAYRVLLKVEPSDVATIDVQESKPPGYADYERKPVVLSEEEYREVQQRVLSRCGLDRGAKQKAPWYYYYELGLELAKQQDPQRALDALIEAVERRPDSRHAARMYGMWFIDYLPYFEIAKQHTILGNRECALDALRASEASSEVPPDDERHLDFVSLKAELEDVRDQ